mmetsp:Transcript_27155/g.43098  ORF Transcript_27155/g.43098 Transcript_27155/m.43098 type:complete len:201 (-) Transcript_27155:613-1215(-)
MGCEFHNCFRASCKHAKGNAVKQHIAKIAICELKANLSSLACWTNTFRTEYRRLDITRYTTSKNILAWLYSIAVSIGGLCVATITPTTARRMPMFWSELNESPPNKTMMKVVDNGSKARILDTNITPPPDRPTREKYVAKKNAPPQAKRMMAWFLDILFKLPTSPNGNMATPAHTWSIVRIVMHMSLPLKSQTNCWDDAR